MIPNQSPQPSYAAPPACESPSWNMLLRVHDPWVSPSSSSQLMDISGTAA